MSKKNYLQILLLFTWTFQVTSQSNDLSLFGSGGGMTVVNDRYLSYSIGEPCITEVFAADRWVTEGFQQPDAIDLTTSVTSPDGKYVIDVFPNPFSASLNIRGNALPAYDCKIIDITGHVLHSGSLKPEGVNELHLQQLTCGIYYLHLSHPQETSLIIPIIKI